MSVLNAVVGKALDYVNDGVKLFLVIDFDGVINVFYHSGKFKKEFYSPTHNERHPNPHYDPNEKHRHGGWYYGELKEPKTFKLVWSDELVKDINKLAASPDVQVVYLTTWREHMGDVIDRLGLTSSREPVYLPWGDGLTDHSLKVAAFKEFFAGVNSGDNKAGVVWADDVVLNVSNDWYEDFTDGILDNSDRLLVAPFDWYGISRAEMDEMSDFSKKFVS